MHRVSLHRLTMPILRIGMGVFLAYWGVDKLVALEGSVGIFSSFYGLDVGAIVVQVAGVAEIGLGALLAVGLFRIPMAWIQLVVNGVSTLASWRQILDPWAVLGIRDGGNAHLFLASIVITAASVVLVLNAPDDALTLDRRFGRSPGAGPGAPPPA
ncbi:MAG: DoxX family membrane protein [Gemmatimonadetes bacterium]|nr:DoxX family membrane protein [Gemmatimonadota bacterium]NIR81307.1 DoxX family membrane protein [Gemmatimonadota bacterium]NIT90136.1 DoxX family membrane protein [Gemmatimonadota bacterium]NIU33968.1 DoxX family membrane protein [Gemmatimonadota bacterium]NIU38139.1 DoxX family membrane protein [Gemmatimonadota bacterium]